MKLQNLVARGSVADCYTAYTPSFSILSVNNGKSEIVLK